MLDIVYLDRKEEQMTLDVLTHYLRADVQQPSKASKFDWPPDWIQMFRGRLPGGWQVVADSRHASAAAGPVPNRCRAATR